MLTERGLRDEELARREGPVLSDGTRFRDLFDLERREVALRVIADPEIYELELDRIFARSWIVVGHESEIPNPGDFKLRQIGEDTVIMTRATDNSVNLLLNVCAHRGMEVCYADTGNTDSFKCPYHGWVFDNTGKLRGVPYEQEMFGGSWDKSGYGLGTVRMETRHGFVFGNCDPAAPPLDEFLGEEFLWYFDKLYGASEWQAINRGTARSLFQCNWKPNADQNQGDFLHAAFLHHAQVELGQVAEDYGQHAVKVNFPDFGHTINLFEPQMNTPELQKERNKLPLDERGFALSLFPSQSGIFMSLGGMMGLMGADAGTKNGPSPRIAALGSSVPRGVGRMEFSPTSLMLVSKDVGEEQRAMMRNFGGGGVGSGIGMEDHDAWRSITKAARGRASRRVTMKFASVDEPRKPEGWEGPGIVYTGLSKDDTQWSFWRHYFDVMTRDEA